MDTITVPARRVARTRAHAAPSDAVVATVLLLLAGFALQLLVYGHGGRSSLSDLPHLVLGRGIGPGAPPYLDRPLEYPVGSGVLFYLATLVTRTPLGVLALTAVGATAAGVAVTVALERRVGPAVWRWALATPLLIFAFQNWDVFAIAAMVLGLSAFERGEDTRAGVWLAVGAFVKLFPLFVVPPLAVLRWSSGDRRGARRLVLAGACTVVALNLPVLVASPRGWWFPLQFQSRRQATWGTVWHYVYGVVGAPVHGPAGATFANTMSLILLAGAMVALMVLVARRRPAAAGVAAAAVAAFILTNKVYSPTYDLWLVPFFVLLAVPRRVWVAFCTVDLAVAVLVFGYFHGLTTRAEVHVLLPVFVLARAAVVVMLVVVALRTAGRPRVARSALVLDGDAAAERSDRGGVEAHGRLVDAERGA